MIKLLKLLPEISPLKVVSIIISSFLFASVYHNFIIYLTGIPYTVTYIGYIIIHFMCINEIIEKIVAYDKYKYEQLIQLSIQNYEKLKDSILRHDIQCVKSFLKDDNFVLPNRSIDKILVFFSNDNSMNGREIRNIILNEKHRNVFNINITILNILINGNFIAVEDILNNPNMEHLINKDYLLNQANPGTSLWFENFFTRQKILLR